MESILAIGSIVVLSLGRLTIWIAIFFQKFREHVLIVFLACSIIAVVRGPVRNVAILIKEGGLVVSPFFLVDFILVIELLRPGFLVVIILFIFPSIAVVFVFCDLVNILGIGGVLCMYYK